MKSELTKMSQGIGFKVLLILGVVSLLAIGLELQNQLVGERQSFRNEAVSRTVSEWGGEQRFAGPFLRIPFRETVVTAPRESHERLSFAYVLPEEFAAEAKLEGQTRSRGIYEVPLYRASLAVTGKFALSADRNWFPPGAKILWDRAEICYFLRGARGLEERPQVIFDGTVRESVRTPLGNEATAFDGFSFPVALALPGTTQPFRLNFSLRGGASFGVFPAGRDSTVRVRSDGGFPEFGGDFLPSSRDLTGPGFQAEWKIPSLARSIPSSGTSESWALVLDSMPFASFDLGVAFDSYQLINRSLKYGLLFIVVPFVGLFLYEVFARRRLHPVQYLLVGLAVMMFYLLVLSLSERMAFDLAFLAGSLSVCALLAVYGAAILRGKWSGTWGFLGMGGLYALLYLIIRSEDNALLVGTVFLFALLATVMVATRSVDWYGVGKSRETLESPEVGE